MTAGVRRIGILAGGGNLPGEIAARARAHGTAVHIVAIDGEADGDFTGYPVTWVNWGQVGRIVRALKGAGDDIVIVGRVRRPDLRKIRTDLGFFLSLPSLLRILAAGGDDSVLRRVVRFFEKRGLRVLSPADVAPELVVGAGPFGSAAPSPGDATDIALGFRLVRALGPYDIGQSVVVAEGQIEAIEGAEGTDAMIERVGHARRAAGNRRGGVLVKRTKPRQDLRVDMPAIGPETIARAREAGLAGVAVEAGRVLVVKREATLAAANAAGLFVVGSEDKGEDGAAAGLEAPGATSFATLGSVRVSRRHERDIRKGAAVLAVLVPFGVGRGVAVVSRYVLAVEVREGVPAMVARAVSLRQWGVAGRRGGVVALADASELTPSLVEALDRGRYAGIFVAGPARSAGGFTDAVAAADRAGLFVVAPAVHAEEDP